MTPVLSWHQTREKSQELQRWVSFMNMDTKKINKIQANWIQQHIKEITYHNQLGFIPEMQGFRIGASHARKTNHVIRQLGLWVMWYQPHFHGGVRDWKLSSITWSNLQLKLCYTEAQWHLLTGEHTDVPVGWGTLIPQGEGMNALRWDPPRPCPMYLFIWLVLNCIL